MIYLLDTDTFIFMIRGLKASRRHPSRRARATALVKRCQHAQKADDKVGVSAVTVSELEFGARNSDSYEKEMEAVDKILRPFDTFDYETVDCPVQYGRIRHDLQIEGRPIGSMDLMIAAHALSLDATLVTNNSSHFARIKGLKTVNWSTA